jgi:nucleotide-binding universal stress UspA family protein
MTPRRVAFHILAAVDGSAQARAALVTLMEAPWPDGARVRAVVARHTRSAHQHSVLFAALDRSADDAAERARRTLADRWPDAQAIVVNKSPIEGILAEASKFHADVIVVGWRGYGAARRLLMGSVSRGVVRRAKCPVLVVRRGPAAAIRHIMIAFDGSPNARRAVSLVARLSPARGGRVTLVGVAELTVPTSRGPAVAGIRASIARELKRINTERYRTAMTGLNRAALELTRAGWRTRTELRTGEPLRQLIDCVSTSQAELLVVGARGTSGVRHLLLGSVAEGVLNRSLVPVLLAR